MKRKPTTSEKAMIVLEQRTGAIMPALRAWKAANGLSQHKPVSSRGEGKVTKLTSRRPPAPAVVTVQRSLYLAYGSNLNVGHMAVRCPKAGKVGPYHLNDGALVFRGVADVEGREGSIVPAGLWEITKECEAALDRYEGVSCGMYRKVYAQVDGRRCLFYKMRETGVMPPGHSYLETIVQGYEDFGLDKTILEEALMDAWGRKHKTQGLQRRFERMGRPSLARALRGD